MRTDVEFASRGDLLRCWLYTPDGPGPAPAVVIGHGFTGVKEMGLDGYAQAFCDRGIAALVLDYPGFGASDGEPRQEADPIRQVQAYRDGLSFLEGRDDIENRFGVWGSSFGGGHSITVTGLDDRVSCAVAQVPHVSSPGSDVLPDNVKEMIRADDEARAQGHPAATIPVVTDVPGTFAAIQGDERAYRYFLRTKEKMAPRWENEVTVRTLRLMLDHSPIDYASSINVPFLIITASKDVLTTPESARQLAEAIGGSAKVIELPCTHFEVYSKCLSDATAAAADFFAFHLVRTAKVP